MSLTLLLVGEQEMEAASRVSVRSLYMLGLCDVVRTYDNNAPVSTIYLDDSLHKSGDKGDVGTHLQFI